jgi:hypothetical protein
MESARFDAVTRALAQGRSRRATLLVTLGAVLGASGLDVSEEVSAGGACNPVCGECQQCDKGKCRKKHGKKRCKPGLCTSVANGTGCAAGACVNGICTNLKTDETNCGSVGNACGATQICQEGVCLSKSNCPATLAATCNGGIPATSCGTSGDLIGCFCAPSTEGNVVCVQLPPPGGGCEFLVPCTSSANCPSGQLCAESGSCCPPNHLPARACFAPCTGPTV